MKYLIFKFQIKVVKHRCLEFQAAVFYILYLIIKLHVDCGVESEEGPLSVPDRFVVRERRKQVA